MVTHLEPDILECEVKCALGKTTTNKSRRGDEIPAELFQILKDDAVKALQSMSGNLENSNSGHRTGKGQFSFQFQRKAIAKNVQTIIQSLSIYILVRLCSKSFKLQHYMNLELPDV